MDTHIRQLLASDTDEVTALLGQHFVTESVLHTALGVDPCAWQSTLQADLDIAVSEACSVVAESANGALVGCVLAWTCAQATPISDHSSDPLRALLAALRRGATPPRDNTLHVDMAVVAPDKRGAGLYRRMRETVHNRASAKGFDWVRGELSSAATQMVCRANFGHKLLHEIAFASFTWHSESPFSGIESPPTIQLVEGQLKTSTPCR